MSENEEYGEFNGEIWDEVISDWFPNASEDEIEEELDNWFND